MPATKADVTLLAAGDLHVRRDDPDSMFANVTDELHHGDIVFGQLEASYSTHDRRAIPVTVTPGFNALPSNVPAIGRAGFNVISMASNHTADHGHTAFVDTIEHLNDAGCKVIGAGRNLAEARTPALFDVNGTRVALLSYCAILRQGYDAREKLPGMAPMRVRTFYEQVDWQPGTPPVIHTHVYQEDEDAILEDIAKARELADIVVASTHWGVHYVSEPAMYQVEMGHKILDAGADIVIGHHTHRLNPIEIYKGKVIFYGIGGFAFEPRGSGSQARSADTDYPFEDLYPYDEEFAPVYRDREKDPALDLPGNHSILAKVEINDKKITRVSFKPVLLNNHHEPIIEAPGDKAAQETIAYFNASSRKRGVHLKTEGDELLIWSAEAEGSER